MIEKIDQIRDLLIVPSVDEQPKIAINQMKILNLLIELRSEAEQCNIADVSNWVAISSKEQPEIMTDVMVKYKDGRKEVAFFDGDKRFYIEKYDRDITETIVEWHKLP